MKQGTVTDENGKYKLTLGPGTYSITFSSVGYSTKTVVVSIGEVELQTLNTSLTVEAKQMQEIVVLGSRSQERTVIDSPLPIDIISLKEITSTGQNSFDKILQYRVPSFNTVQTPVNDATALLDPFEIRNMGVSRTLILINGKRKNLSALVYTQTSPSRGESGSDISAIPVDAIKRVEILRDGASAQYGRGGFRLGLYSCDNLIFGDCLLALQPAYFPRSSRLENRPRLIRGARRGPVAGAGMKLGCRV